MLIIYITIDSSFLAIIIIFSNAVLLKYQGISASVVMTIINYKEGYRGAFYFEVGLAGLGLVMSLVFLVKDHLRKKGAVYEESA
ncbi:hypothetical protein GB937_006768 [Aspergillus fischeri]|nr:hypothetical protein GB937_006768 [Aspergillus fischeri]